jgi:hypothetical protein
MTDIGIAELHPALSSLLQNVEPDRQADDEALDDQLVE